MGERSTIARKMPREMPWMVTLPIPACVV